MKRPFFLSKWGLFWLNLAFWLGLTGIRYLQHIYYSLRAGEEFDMRERLIWMGSDILSMWIMSFVIYVLYVWSRSWRVGKFVSLHFLASILLGFVNLVLSLSLAMLGTRLYREPKYAFFEALQINLEKYFTFAANGFLMYWVILLILFALHHYALFRAQQQRATQLATQLSKAQLQTLKMQLHPHFLFNALNTISMMVRSQKNTAAVQMISGLGDLLRHSLALDEEQFTPFSQEMKLIQKYLDIEKVRFKDTLNVEIAIPPETQEALIPSLLLQPLLENAFKHGIAHQLGESELRISSWKEEDQLHLEIYNTGPLLPHNWKGESAPGIGLSNTRTRLTQLYADQFELNISNANEKGVLVHISIPFVKAEPSRMI